MKNPTALTPRRITTASALSVLLACAFFAFQQQPQKVSSTTSHSRTKEKASSPNSEVTILSDENMPENCCGGTDLAAGASSQTVSVQNGPTNPGLKMMEARLNALDMKLQWIEMPDAFHPEIEIIVPNGDSQQTLKLRQNNVRSENFRVARQLPDGSLQDIPIGDIFTYGGDVSEDSNKTAYATFYDGGMSARIYDSIQKSRVIEMVSPEEQIALGSLVPEYTGRKGKGRLHVNFSDASAPNPCGKLTPEQIAMLENAAETLPADITTAQSSAANAPTKKSAPVSSGPTAAPENEAPPLQTGPQAPVAAAPGTSGINMRQVELGFDVAYSYYNARGGRNATTTMGKVTAWLNNDLNPTFIQGTLVEHIMGVYILRDVQADDHYNGLGNGNDVLNKIKSIWNGSTTPSTSHDLAHCVLSQGLNVTGLAFVGVVGTSNRYGITTAASGEGFFRSGARHEIGHNWSLSHGDGCTAAVESISTNSEFGLMCGGPHERMNSVESTKTTNHRNSRGTGVLITPPSPLYTARPITPYLKQDNYVSNAGAPQTVLDVLANDFDANGDNFTIVAIDAIFNSADNRVFQSTPTSTPTNLGGAIIRSIGTGPGGRDTLLYTPPPASSPGGTDQFHYFATDTTGRSTWGHVKIIVGEPIDPFGNIVNTGLLTDSILNWDPSLNPETTPDWVAGYYNGSGAFIPATGSSDYFAWAGGDTALGKPDPASSTTPPAAIAPRVGQYAMDSNAEAAVRRWTSNHNGPVSVEFTVHRLRDANDGQTARIRHNGISIWSQLFNDTNIHYTGRVFASVKPGDTIDLIQESGANTVDDFIQFSAKIYERPTVREDSTLAFHYKMDEGSDMPFGEGGNYDRRTIAADSSGNNRRAIVRGIPTPAANDAARKDAYLRVWRRGVMGNAYEADGNGDYLETVDSGIGNGASAITLSAWVRPDAKGPNDGIISVADGSPDFFAFTFTANSAAGVTPAVTGFPIEFRAKSNALRGPNGSVPTGKWSHVVGVWQSGSFQKIYVDGVLVNTSTTPVPSGTVNVTKWYVGRDRNLTGASTTDANQRDFDGRVDDVALWTRAFDDREVQALYQQGQFFRNFKVPTDQVDVSETFTAPNTQEMTLAAWFRPEIKGNNDGIFTSLATGSYFGFTLGAPGPETNNEHPLQFRAQGAPLNAPINAQNNSAPVGEWTQAVGVWKSGQIFDIYINGELAASATPPTGTATLTGWRLGRDRDFTDRYFDGQISDTMVINRALSPEEIASLYNRDNLDTRTAFDASHGLINSAAAIGTLSLAGNIYEGSGSYALSASGTGISADGTSDSIQFSRLNQTGDSQVTLRLDSVENTGTSAIAGIMLRSSNSVGSPCVVIAARPDRSVAMFQRVAENGPLTQVAPWQTATTNSPRLRFMRLGNHIAARYSNNGTTWTQLGLVTTSVPSNGLLGVFNSSGTQSALSTAVFSDLRVGTLLETDIDGDSLPDAWENAQLGGIDTSNGGSNDHDGDGQSDRIEYLAGANPNNSANSLRITETTIQPGNQIQLTWQAITGKTYRIMRSTDLGTWEEAASNIPATVPLTSSTVAMLPEPSTRCFYRIEVENPNP